MTTTRDDYIRAVVAETLAEQQRLHHEDIDAVVLKAIVAILKFPHRNNMGLLKLQNQSVFGAHGVYYIPNMFADIYVETMVVIENDQLYVSM